MIEMTTDDEILRKYNYGQNPVRVATNFLDKSLVWAGILEKPKPEFIAEKRAEEEMRQAGQQAYYEGRRQSYSQVQAERGRSQYKTKSQRYAERKQNESQRQYKQDLQLQRQRLALEREKLRLAKARQNLSKPAPEMFLREPERIEQEFDLDFRFNPKARGHSWDLDGGLSRLWGDYEPRRRQRA